MAIIDKMYAQEKYKKTAHITPSHMSQMMQGVRGSSTAQHVPADTHPYPRRGPPSFVSLMSEHFIHLGQPLNFGQTYPRASYP